jgi:hypothetical protein
MWRATTVLPCTVCRTSRARQAESSKGDICLLASCLSTTAAKVRIEDQTRELAEIKAPVLTLQQE